MRAKAAIILIGLGLIAGCATPRGKSEGVTPMIAISPGVGVRLALMDRYRLHDEDRKHMMERPHVWVEEVPDDEAEAEGPSAEARRGEPGAPTGADAAALAPEPPRARVGDVSEAKPLTLTEESAKPPR